MSTPNRTPLYRIAKLGKWLQRGSSGVLFGFLVILGSHWLVDPGEKEFCRDGGATIAGFSFMRWLSMQGKRRVDPNTGRQVRTPTLRMDQTYIDRALRGGK